MPSMTSTISHIEFTTRYWPDKGCDTSLFEAPGPAGSPSRRQWSPTGWGGTTRQVEATVYLWSPRALQSSVARFARATAAVVRLSPRRKPLAHVPDPRRRPRVRNRGGRGFWAGERGRAPSRRHEREPEDENSAGCWDRHPGPDPRPRDQRPPGPSSEAFVSYLHSFCGRRPPRSEAVCIVQHVRSRSRATGLSLVSRCQAAERGGRTGSRVG